MYRKSGLHMSLLACLSALCVASTHAATGSTSVTFLALGDQGSGDEVQRHVAQSMEQVAEQASTPDFVAFLGDNFYPKGVESTDDPKWQTHFEQVYTGSVLAKTPFYSVLGNHDHMQNAQAEIDYSIQQRGSKRWHMPNAFYSADFGSVNGRPLLRVVFIDTCLDKNGLQTEAEFIKQQFAESATSPLWKIVMGHYPVRNHGKHSGQTPDMDAIIKPALQAAHVDVYLAGHDHDEQVIAQDGEPLYVISGGGGAELYPVTTGADDLKFSQSAHGFLSVTLDAAHLEFAERDGDGHISAQYRIERACSQGITKCLVPVAGQK